MRRPTATPAAGVAAASGAAADGIEARAMHSSYRYRPSLRDRLSAIIVSLAVLALIVLALIRMGLIAPGAGSVGERLTAITFRTQQADRAEHKAAARAVRHERQAATRQVVTSQPRPQQKPEVVPPLQLLKLTREEFAAADISRMAKHPAENADSSGPSGASAYGPGEGPGGARLYNAEWYREPTHAELVTYMPHRDVSGGWAMIACKTQERFHVDDCQELGESPPGSGLARALRQAAWQFLVRPPRLDGKPIIGAWVRIRFDFTRGKDSGTPDPAGG
jgi:protein TonB